MNRHAAKNIKKFRGVNRFALPDGCLKDSDINRRLEIPPEHGEALAAQLKKDVSFLCSQGIMDYSLLLGVHRRRFEILSDTSGGVGSAATLDANELTPGRVKTRASLKPVGTTMKLQRQPSAEMCGRFSGPEGNLAAAVEGPGIYYMGKHLLKNHVLCLPLHRFCTCCAGLIDILQEWNFGKKLERFFKTWIRGQDADGEQTAHIPITD